MSEGAEAQNFNWEFLAHSGKASERRLPIRPAHLRRIDHRLRQRMYVEHDYAKRYGGDDGELAELMDGSGPMNS